MGRKSKLTEKQWHQVGERLLKGESARSLGREFGVSESAIRLRLSAHTETVKSVAAQMVAVDAVLNSLPIAAQISAHNLAADLRAISNHLAGAAKLGAMTAHKLNRIAQHQVKDLKDNTPMEDCAKTLQFVSALSKVANSAGEIGTNLLRANKEAVDAAYREQDKPAEISDSVAATRMAAILASAQARRGKEGGA